MNIYHKVEFWYCYGIPKSGLTEEERKEVIQSAQESYLAEHVGMTEDELNALENETLVRVHYSAMVDASR